NDLSILLIERWDSLRDKTQQAKRGNEPGQLDCSGNGAAAIDREWGQNYESNREGIGVQQVLVVAHAIVSGEKPGNYERGTAQSRDETPQGCKSRGRESR